MGIDDEGYVIVLGDVQADTAVLRLARILAQRTCNGTQPASVDLSAMTSLSPAAIAVLATACQRALENGTRCTLIAVCSGQAHKVLDGAGLPFVLE